MDRRAFLKSVGLAGAFTLAGPEGVQASSTEGGGCGVLVDTTRCGGCQACEQACAEAHGLPPPDPEDEPEPGRRRDTSPTRWTVVNACETEDDEVYVKRQCMHCVEPACASACLTKAMLRTEKGPVIWREDRCMGCRFCMISCPFDVPRFEYDSPVPRIGKCILCWDRLRKGQQPACVESCPNDALLFGRRSDLIETARARIYAEPDSYVHHIYGEHEAGGTRWLYLSSVPFERLGFRTDLGTTAFPQYTTGFLYSVPVVLALWPVFLLAVRNATRSAEGREDAVREKTG